MTLALFQFVGKSVEESVEIRSLPSLVWAVQEEEVLTDLEAALRSIAYPLEVDFPALEAQIVHLGKRFKVGRG